MSGNRSVTAALSNVRRRGLMFCNTLNLSATLAMLGYFVIFILALSELFQYRALSIDNWFWMVVIIFPVSIGIWLLAVICLRAGPIAEGSLAYRPNHFFPIYFHFFEFLIVGLLTVSLVAVFRKAYSSADIEAFESRYDIALKGDTFPFPYDVRMYIRWMLIMFWIVISFIWCCFRWVAATRRHRYPKMSSGSAQQPLLGTTAEPLLKK